MSNLRPAFTNAEVDGLRRLLAKDDAEGQRIAELETKLAKARAENERLRDALVLLLSWRDYMHPGDIVIAEKALAGEKG